MSEVAQRVLERRATELARPPVEESQSSGVEIVTVTVAGGRRYAIEAGHVQQILRNERLSRLPPGSGELVGLLFANGEAVPVADLASLLGLSEPDRARPFILLLDRPHLPVGLLVDEFLSIRRISEAALRTSAEGFDNAPSPERGVTADGTVLLDTHTLLADPRLGRAARTTDPTDRALHQRSGESCEE